MVKIRKNPEKIKKTENPGPDFARKKILKNRVVVMYALNLKGSIGPTTFQYLNITIKEMAIVQST